MRENPLISVILPIYNVEQYLCTCIESVIEQEYQNIEIILVDDGATDSSPSICDEYAKKDSRIQVIHQNNAGLSSARNSGLYKARGEYIFFLDSDDCIHPSLLILAVNMALEKKVKIVQVELEMVASNFTNYKKDVCNQFSTHEFNRVESIYNLDQDNPKYGKDIRLVTTVIWSKLYHRSIFEKVHFVDGIRIHEDQMIIHRFLAEADGMCFINLPLYYYRNNEDSLIRRKWKEDKLIILDCYNDRLKCALEIVADTKPKKQLVNLVYRRYLICIIKNYMMAMKYLSGEIKKNTLNQILKRFRQEFREEHGDLSKKDKIVFYGFSIFPQICVLLYSKIMRGDN